MKATISFLDEQIHNEKSFASAFNKSFGDIYNIEYSITPNTTEVLIEVHGDISMLYEGYFISIEGANLEIKMIEDHYLYIIIDIATGETWFEPFPELITEGEEGALAIPIFRTYSTGTEVTADITPNTLLASQGDLTDIRDELSMFKEQKVLLDTAAYMHATQELYLSERVSEQNSGIVCVWSRYDHTTNTKLDTDFHSFFIPKELVYMIEGKGHTMQGAYSPLAGTTFPWFIKLLYIYDDRVKGWRNNVTAPNNNMVLRYVIGV